MPLGVSSLSCFSFCVRSKIQVIPVRAFELIRIPEIRYPIRPQTHTLKPLCIKASEFKIFQHHREFEMDMSSESDSENYESVLDSESNELKNDKAGKRLKKAKAQRKKEMQELKNLKGRTIKKKKEESKKRLTSFKVSL